LRNPHRGCAGAPCRYLSNLRFISTVGFLSGLRTLDKGGGGRDCGAE
jgi:hypothetical protein